MTHFSEKPSPNRLIAGVMRWGQWGAGMSPDEQHGLIRHCLDLGIDTFDLANIYGDYSAESEFGRAMALESGLRDRMRLITKFGIRKVSSRRPEHRIKSYDSGRKHLIASLENSLRDLKTDRIDLLLIHRPDFLMEPAEIADTVAELKEAGKLIDFGVSNFSPSQFSLLNSHTALTTNQIEVSLTQLDAFQDGRLDQALALGFQPQAWSPLGGGALFSSAGGEREARIRQVLARLSEETGASPDQLALAWLLRHPAGLRPVLGSTRVGRLKSAVEATRIEMDRETWYELWTASTGQKVP